MPQAKTTRQRAQRDQLIVNLRASGASWKTISEHPDVQLEPRSCRRVWSQWREQEKLDIQEMDPLDIVYDQLTRLETQVERLGDIAEDCRKSFPAAAVGAHRAQGAAMAQQAELMLATGIMPRNLGKVQVELEVRYVLTRLIDIFDRYGLPAEARRELIQVFRRDASDNGSRPAPEQAALPAGDSSQN